LAKGAETGARKGAAKGANSGRDRGNGSPGTGAEKAPLSSYQPSNETADLHHHQHHRDDGDANGVAAAIANTLIKMAGIRFRDQAHGRDQLRMVRSWLDMGMSQEFILYWAEVQLQRRRNGSCAAMPINTVGYFDRELKKEHQKGAAA
jgi:hypothetical protein